MWFLKTLVLGVCLLTASTVFAQPNMEHVLHRVRAQYPSVWHAAHRDYGQQGQPGKTTKAQGELFVRIAAAEMNREHAGTEHAGRWGTNGKRGNCGDLSQDVIQYRLGPNWNQGWDVIPGAGGSSPSIGWNAFDPSTDAQGCFVPGTEVSPAEIAAIMAGGSPLPPPPPPPPTGVSVGDAAVAILEAFHASHHRAPSDAEVAAISAFAQANGWDGGPRISKSIVDFLLRSIPRYSGDPANPFPAVSVEEALRQINALFQEKFQRDAHPLELNLIAQYALRQWPGVGPVPQWLLDDILATAAQYNGSVVSSLPDPIASSKRPDFIGNELFLDGQPFEWLGATAFVLQYDWFYDRPAFEAFIDGMQAIGVNTLRVGVAVGSGYLRLEPPSGGTFGRGRTAPLYPGDGRFSWAGYRAMLEYVNSRGFIVEVVPFLTAGPYNPSGAGNSRPNDDTSVPQMLSEGARMAYLDEVARELLPVKAFVVEIANEYFLIGFHHDGREVSQLALRYKQIDPEREVTTSAYHTQFGDYWTMHMDRRTTPRTWSWVVHQLSFVRPDVYVINDEGINADLVGTSGRDGTPANHWANGVMMRLVPGLSYTFHYDRALKGLPPSANDGSLQAAQAWRDGTRAVPADVSGEYVALPNVLGAEAIIARVGVKEGYVLLIGSNGSPVDLPEWDEELIGAYGPHKLYRLSK